MTHILLQPKKSGKGLLYGDKGDRVKLITAHHSPVLIMENAKKQRFSINAVFVEEIKTN